MSETDYTKLPRPKETIVQLTVNADELAVLDQLARELDASHQGVLRQALRYLQVSRYPVEVQVPIGCMGD
jgi:hypothetical protein